MKKLIFLLTISLAAAFNVAARNKQVVERWDVAAAHLTRSADRQLMVIDYCLDLSHLDVPSQQALLFTPVLANGRDTLRLSPVGIYGRSRYYYYQRHGLGMLSEHDDEAVMRASQCPANYSATLQVPYEDWMNGARLSVEAATYGCCFTLLDRAVRTAPTRFMLPPRLPKPVYVYTPADTMVVDSLEGSAVIQFVVDRTEIKPDWRDNYVELGKITHSIDTIKADPDLTITEVWLKGFASPESPYAHNTDLARGRTQSLKEYIQQLYKFAPGVITTDYEPEDWAGLRRWVAASNMQNRDAILELIDRPMADLDQKEDELKRRFPADYRFLLDQVYPPLRHTEYKVKYRVRRFYDVEEIKRVLEVSPKKLTLNDFHLVANTYKPGSEDFNYVYMLAARIHPDSHEANLNAANAALERGDADRAEEYLQKAGNSPEADYARALLLVLREQYAAALPAIEQAAQRNLPGAADFCQLLQEYLANTATTR